MNKFRSILGSIGYSIIRPILRIIVLFMNPKIVNKENIPKKGGYIFAGTHTSYLDAFVVGSATIRPVHFLAKKELMDVKVLGSILRFIGIIRVDRSTKNPKAVNETLSALKNNQVICLFPEGTICKDKDKLILPFKYGAVSFAHKSGKPIIPFAIVNKPKFFSFKTKLVIGKPFYVKSNDLEKENKKLEEIVINLIKEGKEMTKEKKQKKDHNYFYSIIKPILKVVFWVYYRPKVYNKEVVPKDGPIIICGNHIHLYDQCLPMFSTKRIVHYMAKKEYFDGKFAWFFKACGCISVNRAIHDGEAKKAALEVLNNKNALGIFPEGTRNKTEEPLLPFKMGAVSMAQKTGATLVPFAITGKYKFWNGGLTCTFLEPFKVGKDEDLEKVNEKLRNMILEVVEKDRKQDK